mmetsp:Transcript_2364/g.9949  ORF Transcript_2364/g.9949 Transcript_2364/m.9949 type:complete len:231 (-) Transcript_2364:2945-3637(-)
MSITFFLGSAIETSRLPVTRDTNGGNIFSDDPRSPGENQVAFLSASNILCEYSISVLAAAGIRKSTTATCSFSSSTTFSIFLDCTNVSMESQFLCAEDPLARHVVLRNLPLRRSPIPRNEKFSSNDLAFSPILLHFPGKRVLGLRQSDIAENRAIHHSKCLLRRLTLNRFHLQVQEAIPGYLLPYYGSILAESNNRGTVHDTLNSGFGLEGVANKNPIPRLETQPHRVID